MLEHNFHGFSNSQAQHQDSVSDDFVGGLMDRNDQRDQLPQTSSSVTTQSGVSKAKPILGIIINRLSRFVVAWFLSLSTAAYSSRCRIGSHEITRWRKEAVILLTKSRSSKARHLHRVQK